MTAAGPWAAALFIVALFLYTYPLNLVLNYKLVCHIKSSTDSTSQIIQQLEDGAKMQRTQRLKYFALSPRRWAGAENQFVRSRRVIYSSSMKVGELVCVLWVSRVIGSQMRKHSLSWFLRLLIRSLKFLNCSRLCIMCRAQRNFLCSHVAQKEIENNELKRSEIASQKISLWFGFSQIFDLLHSPRCELTRLRWQEAINETK